MPGSAPASAPGRACSADCSSIGPGRPRTRPSRRASRPDDRGVKGAPRAAAHTLSPERHNQKLCTKGIFGSVKWRLTRSGLLHSSGAEPRVFLIGNRVRILQPLEFLEFIGHAEANDLTKLIA